MLYEHISVACVYEHISVTCVYEYMSVTVYKPVQVHTEERRGHWIWGYTDSQEVSPSNPPVCLPHSPKSHHLNKLVC